MESRAKIVVCFYADGKTKYYPMVTNAIQTFLANSSIPDVGILVEDDETRQELLSKIPEAHSSRVHYKNISSEPHLANWNPTQHKLDMLLFADEYEYIFWVDADTFTISNIDFLFQEFVLDSSYKFWFILDHSVADPTFVRNWEELFGVYPFVPQACFMGFSASIIRQFVEVWRSKWQQWIFPSPFETIADPRPHFSGSEFCTEQYALGNAIEEFEREGLSTRNEIFVIPRNTLSINIKVSEIQKIDRNYFLDWNSHQTSASSVPMRNLKLLQTSAPKTQSMQTTQPSQTSSILTQSERLLEHTGEFESIIVDNILYGSIIHTFGVNYEVVQNLYFPSQNLMSETMRKIVLKDFIEKKEHKLKKFLLELFENENGKDHVIHLTSGSSFLVHKPLIQILCPKLLDGRFIECAPETFHLFLKLIYLCETDDDKIDLSNIAEILGLAMKFQLDDLIYHLKLKLWKLSSGDLQTYTSRYNPLAELHVQQKEGKEGKEGKEEKEEKNGKEDGLESEEKFSPERVFNKLHEIKEATGDFTINLPKMDIKVHKWVISKWNYFNNSIFPSFNQFNNEVSEEVFHKLVKYYYLDDLSIFTPEDCQSIMMNAKELQIDASLRNYCHHSCQMK